MDRCHTHQRWHSMTLLPSGRKKSFLRAASSDGVPTVEKLALVAGDVLEEARGSGGPNSRSCPAAVRRGLRCRGGTHLPFVNAKPC
jgi:hypothetical protein